MKNGTVVTVDHVIAEATGYTADRSFKKGFSKSWYKARVADAIIDMNIDRHYHDMVVDVPLPSNLRVEIPYGFINVEQVFVADFNGTSCTKENMNFVHWKRNFNNNGDPNSYSSKVNDYDSGDNFRPSKSNAGRGNTYYGNEQNGILQLDSACSGFSGVRFVGKGMGVELGVDPVVPVIMERYCVHYVAQMFWLAKMAESVQNAKTMYVTMTDLLEHPVKGSKIKAKKAISKMSGFIKSSLNDYITNPHMK